MTETDTQLTGNGREQDAILAAARNATAALPPSPAATRAAAEGEATDGGDHRLAEVLDAPHQGLPQRRIALGAGCVQLGQLGDVGTRHEGLLAGAGEHHRPDLVIARELMDTEDAAEGIRSFLERREGEFKGR